MRRFIGIDPGDDGAFAVIANGRVERAAVFPRSGDVVDWSRFAVELLQDPYDTVAIEKVHSMPKQGVASSFTFGVNVGMLHGVFLSRGLPFRLVTPQAWKNLVLRDTEKDKPAAIAHVQRAYPDAKLLATEKSRKPHEGIADAVCIAEYAWRTFR